MFYSLLGITFLVAVAVTATTVHVFNHHVDRILKRIVSDELAAAWHRYIVFAAYVVGISGGVNLHKLEQYVNARHVETSVLQLNPESWTLEIYRTVIGTLQSIAWMLLVVFVVALISYVIVRAFELRRAT